MCQTAARRRPPAHLTGQLRTPVGYGGADGGARRWPASDFSTESVHFCFPQAIRAPVGGTSGAPRVPCGPMKRTLAPALAAILWASTCVAGDYWAILSNPAKQADGSIASMLTAIDASRIVYDGTERKAWVYIAEVGDRKITKFMGARHVFRCDQDEDGIIQVAEFDGETLAVQGTDTYSDPEFSSPLPGISAAILQFVCSQIKGQPATAKDSPHFNRINGTELKAVKDAALRYAEFLEAAKTAPASK